LELLLPDGLPVGSLVDWVWHRYQWSPVVLAELLAVTVLVGELLLFWDIHLQLEGF
jgi:hypothetical protein